MSYSELAELIINNSVDKEYIKGYEYDNKFTRFNLSSNNISLSIDLDESLLSISYVITDSEGNVKDADTKPFDNTSDFEIIIKTIIGVFNVMKDDEIKNTNTDNKDDKETLLEEGDVISLPDSLKEVESEVTKIADKITGLASATSDPEMKEIITSIANQAYGLAVDIEEAQETYLELSEESLDEPIEEEGIEEGSEDELDLNV